jgi:uncharacterized protein (TIGR02452 family)
MDKASRAAWSKIILDSSQGLQSHVNQGAIPRLHAHACLDQTRHRSMLFTQATAPTGPADSRRMDVAETDCLLQAMHMLSQGVKKIGVLVFCSARRPKGGWLNGSMAQEESIAMRSTWGVACAHPDFHGLPHADYFYSDAVLAMDGKIISPEIGQWLEAPIEATFVGICAPNMRAAKDSGADPSSANLSKLCHDVLAHRCGLALAAFHSAGCDGIVLGAIGCGVFQIDPAIAASAWRASLAKYGSGFSHISFALGPRPPADILASFGPLSRKISKLAP